MKKLNTKMILILLLIMSMGVAAVSSYVVINNDIRIGSSTDFDVYFSSVVLNGKQNNGLIKTSKSIGFNYTFKEKNETVKLSYDITNGSRSYDANIKMNCISSSELLDVKNKIDTDSLLEASSTRTGELQIKLDKVVIDTVDVDITCELDVVAEERNSKIPDDVEIAENIVDARKNLFELVKSQKIGNSTDIDFNVSSDWSRLLDSSDPEYSTDGVYESVPDNNVYFYRGYTKNNIILNDTCYRIMRTTSEKGVRLIYNGTPNEDGECHTYTNVRLTKVSSNYFMIPSNQNFLMGDDYIFEGESGFEPTLIGNVEWTSYQNENPKEKLEGKYFLYRGVVFYIDNGELEFVTGDPNYYLGEVGYGYGNVTYTINKDGVEQDTAVKSYVDNWYFNTIEKNDLSKYIEDSVYCNDTTEPDTSNMGTIYVKPVSGGISRAGYYAINTSYSYACQKKDSYTVSIEKGNGKLKYPVAVMTIDDQVAAGATGTYGSAKDRKKWGNKNYIMPFTSPEITTELQITMTPGSEYATMDNAYCCSDNGVYGGLPAKVRPVITLKNDVLVEGSGDGSVTKPYRVVLNK